MNPALLIITFFLAFALWLGVRARRGREMTLEQWTVGGRGFGTAFVFVLLAGEIYTTFTFLGASGWAYGKGAPAFYIVAYGAMAYLASYFILPPLWRYAREHGLLSQADFFARKYDSPGLGVLVSLVSVAAMIPYLVLQLKGLGIIVSEASYGALSSAGAVWLSSAVLVIYVVVSGVRGSAWTAVVKDLMILAVAVALGLYLPRHFYGGLQPMFAALEHGTPGFLTLPRTGMSTSWFISTVVLSALGFYMWPHSFGSVYTARSEGVIRRNAIVLPLYQLVMLFVLFVGFAAVQQVPGLRGAATDLALLRVSKQTFDPWVVGTIGAAGLLTALVPGSMLLLTGATILARNVYGWAVPTADDRAVGRVARYLVPVIVLVSVAFTFRGGETIVVLLLLGYNVVTQLFPAFLLALGRVPLATRAGAVAGIVAGEATVAVLSLSKATMRTLFPHWPAVVTDLNLGIVALVVNVVVLVAVSLATRRPAPAGGGAPAEAAG